MSGETQQGFSCPVRNLRLDLAPLRAKGTWEKVAGGRGGTCEDCPVTGPSDADLYDRGARTLVASWEAYARGCLRAAVIRPAGVAVAVFPDGPERAFLNNTLLEAWA